MNRAFRKAACVALAFAISAAPPARAAGEAAGTAAASFLSVGSGASVLGLAGAATAIGGDLAAASWNPAALTQVRTLEFSLAHAPLASGATQDWLSAGGRVGTSDTHWALHALLHNEGSIEGRDAANNPTGSVEASDLAVGVSFAQRLAGFASAGAGVEWLRESLAGTSGSALSFDAGMRARFGAFGVGVAARHLGGAMRYDGASYELPATFAVGGAWSDESRGLRLTGEVERPSHYYPALRVGGEWRWRDRAALRAGYRRQVGEPSEESLSGLSFGMGAGAGNVWLDYAFSPEGRDGAGQHRMSLTFRPGFRMGAPDATSLRTQPEPSRPAPPRPAPARAPQREPEHKPAPEAPKPAAADASAKPVPEAAKPAAETVKPAPAPPAPEPPKPVPAAVPVVVSAPAAPETAAPAKPAARPESIVVAKGETLRALAKRWGTSVTAIMMLNDLVREDVAPGTRLKLPPAAR